MAEIRDAPDRDHAQRAIEVFARDYGAKWPKAVAKVTDDAEELLTFFDFPAEIWITIRGAAPNDLGLDPQPSRLRAWNLDQLHGHWRSFADKAMSGRPPSKPLVPPHRAVTARLLGPPRVHHTIATGEVITKEAGGEYALDTFATRWHPLIRTALGRRTGQPTPARFRLEPDQLPPLAGEFILEVIADADHL